MIDPDEPRIGTELVTFSVGSKVDSTQTEDAPFEHAIDGSDELQLISKAEIAKVEVTADGALLNELEAIPNKMAFKIGEAAEMVGVKQYVLRYWETEFDALRPRKSKNNQRVYSRRDVETAMMIKKLLYDDRFSIEGARAALRQLKTHVKEEKTQKAIAQNHAGLIAQLRLMLSEIRRVREIFI